MTCNCLVKIYKTSDFLVSLLNNKFKATEKLDDNETGKSYMLSYVFKLF